MLVHSVISFELDKVPNVLAFQERMGACPAVQAALKAEGLLH